MPDGLLGVEILEDCAKRFPSPQPGPEILRLFDSWLHADPKPKIPVYWFQHSLDLLPEASFVYWLLSREESAQFVAENTTEGFCQLLSWVRERKLDPLRDSGGYIGAWGAMIRKGREGTWIWEEFVNMLIKLSEMLLPAIEDKISSQPQSVKKGLDPKFQQELDDWYTGMAAAADDQVIAEGANDESGPPISTARQLTSFPYNLLYDFDLDPEGLRFKAEEITNKNKSSIFLSVYEKLIKESGYKGYWKQTIKGPIATVFSGPSS